MHKWGAYRVYLIHSCLGAVFFACMAAYNMVYYTTTIGMNPLQLVLVGTMLEVSVFLFEVPTGIVADLYSRRLSIIIGVFLIGVGFTVEGTLPLYWAVMLSQFIWGVGYTFTSGATSAWIVDELGEANVGQAFLRGGQIGTLGGVVGILLGTALATVAVNLPVLVGGIGMMALALLLIFIMPETGFHPTPREDRTTFRHMVYTFREGVKVIRVRPMIVTLLAVGVIWGLASEGYDRLWQKHLLDNFTLPVVEGMNPLVWFGIIDLLGTPVYLIASEIVRRKVNLKQPRRIARSLIYINGLAIAALVTFALTGSFPLAVAAVLLIGAMRGVNGPLYETWLNQNIDSRVRATVLSMAAQTDAIGQIVGGPGVGYIGLNRGVRAALLTSSLILTPILLLYARVLRRQPDIEVEEALTA